MVNGILFNRSSNNRINMKLLAGVSKEDKVNIYQVCIMDEKNNIVQGTLQVTKELLDILQNNIPNICWLEDNIIDITETKN